MAIMIYSLYDKKMSQFTRLIISDSLANMRRILEREFGNPKSQISDYPEDFDVYFISEVDVTTGALIGPAKPEYVISCVGAWTELANRLKARDPQATASLGNLTEDIHSNLAKLEERMKNAKS